MDQLLDDIWVHIHWLSMSVMAFRQREQCIQSLKGIRAGEGVLFHGIISMNRKSWNRGILEVWSSKRALAEWDESRPETCRFLKAKCRILIFGSRSTGRYWEAKVLLTEDINQPVKLANGEVWSGSGVGWSLEPKFLAVHYTTVTSVLVHKAF